MNSDALLRIIFPILNGNHLLRLYIEINGDGNQKKTPKRGVGSGRTVRRAFRQGGCLWDGKFDKLHFKRRDIINASVIGGPVQWR